MDIAIREIAHTDEPLAMRFASLGMHLDVFANDLLNHLYARHFWYLEKNKATQCIAAYDGGRLLGVLLAQAYDEAQPFGSIWRRAFVRLGTWLMRRLSPAEAAYDAANERMLAAWKAEGNEPDGELSFLAADPERPVPGVGSALLAELERREAGKLFFLYTDDACTYQFYEHRGFTRVAEEVINVGTERAPKPLRCFLYAKQLGTA